MVVLFHVVLPAAKQRTYTVHLPILLGRGEEAKFRVPHDRISRRHCEFFERQGLVYLRDLGSTNGTFLNDQQVPANTEASVPPGAVVRVGGLSLRVEYQPLNPRDSTTTATAPDIQNEFPVGESQLEGGPVSGRAEPDFPIEHPIEHHIEHVDAEPIQAEPEVAPDWPVIEKTDAQDGLDNDELNSFFKGLE